MPKKVIAILLGGCSVEHEISLISATSIIKNIDQNIFEIIPILISKDGKWNKVSLEKIVENGKIEHSNDSFLVPSTGFNLNPRIFEILDSKISKEYEIDVVFPVLHGTYGEDGAVQGVLELMGVPYVGASVLGSAIGMDKIVMKSVLRANDIPVVDYVGFTKDEWNEKKSEILDEITQKINVPCFVKSADLGSSVGIKKIDDVDEVEDAINYSFDFSNRVIVEKAVENPREIEVSVLGGSVPKASNPGEIVPKREFYDYESKYHDDSTDLIIPADLDSDVVSKLQDFSVRTFKALSCSGMGRIDFLVGDGSNDIFVSELNTIPGFTSVSMYPKLWEASGLSYKDLVSRLIEIAFEDFAKKKSLKTSYF